MDDAVLAARQLAGQREMYRAMGERVAGASVATVPAARGRGLSSELMRTALRAARADGCDVTTLEATALGEPVYARLGYRSLGRLGMYELRRPAPAA